MNQGMGGHQSHDSKTEEWLTPPAIIEKLGGWESFDLDPCSPVNRPWPTARKHYTIEDNGLLMPWTVTTLANQMEVCLCHCHNCNVPNAENGNQPQNSTFARIESADTQANAGDVLEPTTACGRRENAFSIQGPAQSKTIASECQLDTNAAPLVKQSGLSPLNASQKQKVDCIGTAGAAHVFGSAQNSIWPRPEKATRRKRGKSSYDTIDPSAGESGKESGPRQTTILEDSVICPSHSNGLLMTGNSVSQTGVTVVPIVVPATVSSPKIISSQLALPIFQEQLRETCSQFVSHATSESETNHRLPGSATPSFLAERCHICGLFRPRKSRIFVNPPYRTKMVLAFLNKLADHGCGTALIFARTETDPFFRTVWERATAMLFIRSRLYFHRLDGSVAPHNAGAPSVLVAYGAADAAALERSGIAGSLVHGWRVLS